jgi:single-strand DNA-binding protein
MAQNVSDSLVQGDLVVITGRLKQHDYEVEGQRRSSYEIEPDAIGISLRFVSASINRTQRVQAQAQQYQGQGADDPWAQAAQQGHAQGVQPQQRPAQQAPQQPGWGQQPPPQQPQWPGQPPY